MRRLPPIQTNFVVRRERDWRALRRLALLLSCGLVLAGGFVFAASQHFAAVDYGYKSEALRREQARLMEEQRRLLLIREEMVAPANLENAAREIGMQPLEPAQVGSVQSKDQALAPASPAMVNPTAAFAR